MGSFTGARSDRTLKMRLTPLLALIVLSCLLLNLINASNVPIFLPLLGIPIYPNSPASSTTATPEYVPPGAYGYGYDYFN